MKTTIWCVFNPRGKVRACGMLKYDALWNLYFSKKKPGMIVYSHNGLALSKEAKRDGWTVEKVEVEG